MNEIAIVYVGLLDEGVAVARPARAEKLGPNVYRLLGPVPETESWQFQPGEHVLCEMKTFEDGHRVLFALQRQPKPDPPSPHAADVQ